MHCPVTCGERRPGLEKHLKDRGFMDVEWITDYSTDHSYVRWLHKRLGEKASLAHISGLIKGLEMFRKVARDTSNTKWFWKGDDDIRFIKHWDKVQHVPDERLMYVNLSIGVNFGILPDGKPRLIGNNGGAEVFCFTREFAQLFLDNIDIRQSGDILIHAFMNHIGHPLVCVPIAHQTSLLETKTSSLVIDNKLTPWIDFLKNFKPTGVRYEDLRNESGFFTRDDA